MFDELVTLTIVYSDANNKKIVLTRGMFRCKFRYLFIDNRKASIKQTLPWIEVICNGK